MGRSADYSNIPDWVYKPEGYQAGAMVKYQGNIFVANFWASEPGQGDPNENGWRLYDELYDVTASNATSQTKIIAYLPAYKQEFNYARNDIYRYITHGIIAFLMFDEVKLGEFQAQSLSDVKAIIGDVVNTAHRNGAKVSIALGGATDYGFLYLMNQIGHNPSSPLLNQVVQKVVDFVNTYQLDGVDLDLECWWGKLGEADQGGRAKQDGPHPAGKALALFAQKLRQAMPDKLISAAVFATSWYGNNYDSRMVDYLDWVGVMTYDLTGSWNQSPVGPHTALFKVRNPADYAAEQQGSWPTTRSGQADADPMVDNPILSVEDSLWYWSNPFFTNWQGTGQNIPRNKIAAGVPLYGYDFAYGKPDNQTGYLTVPYDAALIQNYLRSITGAATSLSLTPNLKVSGSSPRPGFLQASVPGNYPYAHNVYFESPFSASVKLNFLKSLGAQGVIIWELTTDAWEQGKSVIKTLYENSGNASKPALPSSYVPALALTNGEGDSSEDTSSSIYKRPHVIGGNGGKDFSLYGGHKGALLRKIGVWAGKSQIKAIQVWLTDSDEGSIFGVPEGVYKEYTFEPGEVFTKLSLWGNGAGTRTGWIEFTTTKGSFGHGMTEWGRKQEYPIDIGSGICCGVMGKAGLDIDNLGFVFLRSVKSARMVDISYPTLNLSTLNKVVKVQALDFRNPSPLEQPYSTPSSTVTETEEFSWSMTTALELAAKATVSGEIPELAKVELELGWKLTITESVGYKNTKTVTVTDPSQAFKVPPYTHLRGTITYYKGTVANLPYEATIELELNNGIKLSYPVKGIYQGVSYSRAAVDPRFEPINN